MVQNGGRCKQIKPGETRRGGGGGGEMFRRRLNDLPRLHLHLEVKRLQCLHWSHSYSHHFLSKPQHRLQNLNFIYGQVKPPSRLMVEADVKG